MYIYIYIKFTTHYDIKQQVECIFNLYNKLYLICIDSKSNIIGFFILR